MSRPSPQRLAAIFELRDQGRVFWIDASKYHPGVNGKLAGGPIPSKGKFYWTISLGGRKYKRSQIVFCLVHGRWPVYQVDHRDGNSLNDSPDNLREATQTQNAWNHKKRAKKSPLPMGVKLLKSGKFQARLSVNKQHLSLGAYLTPDEASAAYQAARKTHFGEFA